MGSHAQDKNTQKTASAGATANDQQLAQNAQKNQAFADQTRQSLFGTNTGGKYSGGSVSQFLDPGSMNKSGLSGAYAQNYNNASNDLAQGAQRAVGTTMQNLASRGMGKAPAGFAADQQRKAYQDAAGQRGDLYSGLATQQHGEDVNNYWNATNMLNSNASQTANLSVAGNQAAAGNYASLYGTASQQVQSGLGATLGTIAGLGGAAGSVMSGVGSMRKAG